MNSSLYEKLGGEPAVSAATEIFYRKVLADETLSGYFDDADMARQIAKQKSFLTMAFGGPNNYTGQDLRKAHAPLVEKGLNGDHFTSVATHLKTTLEELDVSDEIVEEVMSIALNARDDVLGH